MEFNMSIYTKDELISSTEIVRNFSSILDSIKNNRREKVAILRKNKLEAVILPIAEYERIQDGMELLEHLQIFKLVKERESTPVAEYTDFESIIAAHGLNSDDL
jgi:PHD/YefM family antitoxin component YafN of YafNO toxin-antitoxin module